MPRQRLRREEGPEVVNPVIEADGSVSLPEELSELVDLLYDPATEIALIEGAGGVEIDVIAHHGKRLAFAVQKLADVPAMQKEEPSHAYPRCD